MLRRSRRISPLNCFLGKSLIRCGISLPPSYTKSKKKNVYVFLVYCFLFVLYDSSTLVNSKTLAVMLCCVSLLKNSGALLVGEICSSKKCPYSPTEGPLFCTSLWQEMVSIFRFVIKPPRDCRSCSLCYTEL